ncbi:MAG: phosphoenolpyruvate synthase [Candidatus Levybacteria bacterium]|nr:phosphoenolpyruvate synthase [Candidatus Levybacteria bacterium]
MIWSMFLDKPVAIVIQENLKSEIKGKISTGNPVVNIKLTEEQMNKLIKYCKIIQKYFYFPKEIEYVVRNNKVIITKVNALTGTISESPKPLIQNNKTRKVLARGISINPGIVTGRVKVFRNNDNSIEIKRGEIIALSHLDHSMFKKIKNAKAIVIDSVLQNSYEKFLYRKGFQIPTIEGVKNATHLFQNGNVITVNGVSGEIYSGGLI